MVCFSDECFIFKQTILTRHPRFPEKLVWNSASKRHGETIRIGGINPPWFNPFFTQVKTVTP